MALINCPECGKEISDKVTSCPHCGYPLVEESKQTRKPSNAIIQKMIKNKKPIIISVLLLIAVILTSMALINKATLANNEKEKAATNVLFKDSIASINNAGTNASDACSIILNVWSNSGSRDFNSVFEYMFSGDVSNHQYSGLGMDSQGFSVISWGSVARDMNSFKDRLNKLEKEKIDVDSKLDKIKQIKREGNEKQIDAIVSYYNSYIKLYNAATNPSGNQLNYSANLVTMKSEFNSHKVELDMLIK